MVHMSRSDRRETGLSLVEVLVTLVMISILASVAMPYAEVAARRHKELELKHSLREIRTAIDRFHEDWANGDLSPLSGGASRNGYPVSLGVLVDGAGLLSGGARKYLRRIPTDPFADPARPPEEQWVFIDYRDRRDALMWGGDDVYDVRTASEKQAINESHYRDW
jgi:general secretion pathway protein G